jgi:hypothetical protein
MQHTWKIALLLAFLSQSGQGQTLALPPRPAGAFSRDEIIRIITPLSREAREDSLFRYIVAGNVPAFMRTLIPVTSSAVAGGTLTSVTYYVTPDYFAVGSDESYFLTPMTPLLAQRIADSLKCILPTRKMVNAIYDAAVLKLAPAPIPPSAEMITVPVFVRHDSLVWTQRAPQIAAYPPGTLVGGTKKDVVISNKIRNDLKAGVPKPVVIYGWHQLNGVSIQPLYNGHGETYADYSHGIRLVQEGVLLNGAPTTISAILKNDTLAPILSDEGTISIPRYGGALTDVGLESGVLPHDSMLIGNFPNPFNPNSDIRYLVPAQSAAAGSEFSIVRLAVYDLLGREVTVLVDGKKAPGEYDVRFDATGLSSGMYLYRLTAGSFVQTMKMIVLR